MITKEHPGPLLAQAEKIPDPEARIAAYRRLCAAHPRFPLGWVNLAQDLCLMGRLGEAKAAALRAVALDPKQREVLRPELRAALEVPVSATPSAFTIAPPSAASTSPSLEVVGRLGRYRVLGETAAAPCQRLFDAIRLDGDSPVTLRTLPGWAPLAAFRSFVRLTDVVQRLAGCEQAIDVGTDDGGTPYQVLRRLRGHTFADLVRSQSLEPPAVLELVHRVAVILDGLHEVGLVHGALRPEYVFREEATIKRQVVLLALGQAARPGVRTLAVDPGQTVWAPAHAGIPDSYTDIFSLGALLYFGLTGQAPRADQYVTGKNGQLDDVIRRCVTAGGDQFHKAADVATALQSISPHRSLGTLALGGKIGKWQIRRFLGDGTFGAVYEVSNPQFPDQRAAAKVLHPHMAVQPEVRRRFLAEVLAASKVRHEHICQVFDAEMAEDGSCYLLMELLEGGTLSDVLAGGATPWQRAVGMGIQIAQALGAVHERGIVHRDLKPENIIVVDPGGRDFVKVLDFGVAKLLEPGPGGATAPGALLGTPAYMAPEQWDMEPDLDGRTDVYALGLILYNALVGRLPFSADSAGAWMKAHRTVEPSRTAFPGDVPESLRALVLQMMAKDRAARPPSMAEVAVRLAEGRPSAAPRKADVPPANRRRRVWLLSAGATAIVIGVGLTALVTAEHGRGTRATPVSSAAAVGPPCPEGMAKIPAGTFVMGSPEGQGAAAERPQHGVTLSSYCLDRTEVTVRAYAACVGTGSCTTASKASSNGVLTFLDADSNSHCNASDRPNHPVNCVDWAQADVYCRWRGARLPTEAEWEHAARGDDDRRYPWGNEEPGSQLCWNKSDHTCPVGTYPGDASPYGILDMAGNVREWVADKYGVYAAGEATDPTGPATGGSRVMRGGSWNYVDANYVRAAHRDLYVPDIRDINLGFRCARGTHADQEERATQRTQPAGPSPSAFVGSWRETWGVGEETDITYHDVYAIVQDGDRLRASLPARPTYVFEVIRIDGPRLRMRVVNPAGGDPVTMDYDMTLDASGDLMNGTAQTSRGKHPTIRWDRVK